MKLYDFAPEDFNSLYGFMKPLWHNTYGKIIPYEQIEFLLKKYFAPESIKKWQDMGYVYKKIDNVGVLVYHPRESETYIDKLYLIPEARGLGYPGFVFDELLALGKDLTLNVNRENRRAVACYKKYGFEVTESVEIDLGDGMINCDYVMRKYAGNREK